MRLLGIFFYSRYRYSTSSYIRVNSSVTVTKYNTFLVPFRIKETLVHFNCSFMEENKQLSHPYKSLVSRKKISNSTIRANLRKSLVSRKKTSNFIIRANPQSVIHYMGYESAGHLSTKPAFNFKIFNNLKKISV